MNPEHIGLAAIQMRRENTMKPGVLGPMIDAAIRSQDRLVTLADIRDLARELLTVSEMALRSTDQRSVKWCDGRISGIVETLSGILPARAPQDTGTITETSAANSSTTGPGSPSTAPPSAARANAPGTR